MQVVTEFNLSAKSVVTYNSMKNLEWVPAGNDAHQADLPKSLRPRGNPTSGVHSPLKDLFRELGSKIEITTNPDAAVIQGYKAKVANVDLINMGILPA